MALPDFSNDPNRLAIKSMNCSVGRGEWSPPVYDSNGNLVTPPQLIQAWPAQAEEEGRITGLQFAPPHDPNQYILQIQGEPNVIFGVDGRAKGYYKVP